MKKTRGHKSRGNIPSIKGEPTGWAVGAVAGGHPVHSTGLLALGGPYTSQL